ncbi:Endo-beta-N-acetylglucosaminidase [Parasponia andersonii]|uniref:chitinase n=1 Tax=Parasponia andersonii TaxID=3476 RepID=A0A2P5BLC8_PARAD|nr:Endo-beta-N-acetylglucosaminidase [Parasponia andersonii]
MGNKAGNSLPLMLSLLLLAFLALVTKSNGAGQIVVYWGQNGGEGTLTSTPLGSAVLDGIDFDIEKGGAHYPALAQRLSEYSQKGKKFYLSAAPQCPFPDQHLNGALSTGLFDYVLIQFYNNEQCEYKASNPNAFKSSWTKWTTSIKAKKFFVGLPASPSAAGSGYVQPSDLKSGVLPFVKRSSNYGGVMLYDRYADEQTKYSSQIKGSV